MGLTKICLVVSSFAASFLAAFTLVSTPAAADSLFAVSGAEGRVYVSLSDADRTVPFQLQSIAGTGSATFEPVLQSPNRVVYRTAPLLAGLYDLRLGNQTHLLAVSEDPIYDDVAGLATQLEALADVVVKIQASMTDVRAGLLNQSGRASALQNNVTLLHQRLDAIQSQLALTKQGVDNIHVPTNLVQQRDLDVHAKDVKTTIHATAQQEPWYAFALLGAQAFLLGLVTLLFFQRRRPLGDKKPMGESPALGAKKGFGDVFARAAKALVGARIMADRGALPSAADPKKNQETTADASPSTDAKPAGSIPAPAPPATLALGAAGGPTGPPDVEINRPPGAAANALPTAAPLPPEPPAAPPLSPTPTVALPGVT